MNEQILQKILEYLQNTEDFVLEQVPVIIQQVLKYEKISAYCNAGITIFFIFLAIFIGYCSWKYPTLDKYGSRELGSFLGVFIPLLFLPLFFAQLLYSIDRLLKIYIAPKYFLIELISSIKNQ